MWILRHLVRGPYLCAAGDISSWVKLSSRRSGFTDTFFWAVGQEASPSKCVLFSTSEATRKKMKNWAISAGDRSWGAKLDVRDLGGHLDVTLRARGGTLSCKAIKATSQVHMVGAHP